MLAQCSHCGAPLQVSDNARNVTCTYCDHVNRVRTMHTLSMNVPQGWTPPPAWTPPAHMPAKAERPLPYHTHARRAVGWIAGSIAASSVLAAVPVLVSTGAMSHISKAAGEAVGIKAWDGTTPFHCGGNDSVVIKNVTAILPDHTAITAEANCELRIINSRITARQGIRAGGNRNVVVEDSRIETAGTAIWADGNKNIELVRTEIIAGEVGIRAEGNFAVILQRSRLQAKHTGIRAGGNRRIELSDSELKAQETGIRADGNVEIILSGGHLFGSPPLSLASNAEVEQHGTVIEEPASASANKPASTAGDPLGTPAAGKRRARP